MEKLSFNELASEGERLCKSGDCINGIKYFELALNFYENGNGTIDLDEIKVLQTLSIIYNQMGNAYFYLQNYKKALEFHKKDLGLSEQFGDDSGMAKACGNIGNTLQLLGDYDEAIKYSLRNLEMSQKANDLTGEARAFYNLGNIYQSKGKHMGRLLCNRDPTEFPQEVKDVLMHAIDYYRKTLDLVHNKDRAAEGRTYGNLGNTYYLLGEFEFAIECHSERLKIAKEYGDKPAERRAYSNLGNAYIFMGKFTEASEFYLKAMNVAKVLGDRAIEAQAYYSLGNTYTLLQDYTIAIDYHLRHLQIAKQLMDRIGECRAYWSLGNAYAALGEIENAISYANKHLEVAKEVIIRFHLRALFTLVFISFVLKIGDPSSELTAKMNLYDFQSLLGGYSRESEIGLYSKPL
jgi:G-protein signaling modulator 2